LSFALASAWTTSSSRYDVDILPPLVGATDPADNKTSSLTISPTVAQHIHVCASHKKPRLLLKYIATVREQEKAAKVRQAGPMIIFCNKIKTLKFVHDFLKRQNVKVSCVVDVCWVWFVYDTLLFVRRAHAGCVVYWVPGLRVPT
jgi:hypothetical protein